MKTKSLFLGLLPVIAILTAARLFAHDETNSVTPLHAGFKPVEPVGGIHQLDGMR